MIVLTSSFLVSQFYADYSEPEKKYPEKLATHHRISADVELSAFSGALYIGTSTEGRAARRFGRGQTQTGAGRTIVEWRAHL